MIKVVAEIGCNHKGDFDIAKEMIATAANFSKVDVVKFQKRHVPTLLTRTQFEAPHPNPEYAYGASYGEHREALEFSVEQHRELQHVCAQNKVDYSCSVWDEVSAQQIASLRPALIKVPSASNLNERLLDVLTQAYDGEIHLSLGMTTRAEEDGIVDLFLSKGRAKDLVLYACTSAYPVAFDDLCLGEIPRLKLKFGSIVKAIGFSGHHNGISADIAALTLGAEWIERHLTLDRTWRGTDHAASLEPDGLRRLCRDLRSVSKALRPKWKDILDVEQAQRLKLKWERAADA
jgi:sialic acid synthase